MSWVSCQAATRCRSGLTFAWILLGGVLVACNSTAGAATAEEFPIAELVAALGDPGSRQGASRALVARGRAAVAALRTSLRDEKPDSDLRVWSAYTLGEIGSPAASAAADLRACLHADDAALRAAAARAWPRVAGDAAAGDVARLLKDDDSMVGRAAAEALQSLGPRARLAAPQLVEALGDPALRAPARRALEAIGAAAAEALTAAIDDERLRFDAVELLNQLAPRRAAEVEVHEPTQQDLPILRRVLLDAERSERQRRSAARQLAALKAAGAEALAEALAEPMLAPAAVRGFAAAGHQALPVLLATLEDPRPQARAAAATALGELAAQAEPPAEAAAALTRLLSDEDREVRYRAVRALHELGPHAADAVGRLGEVILDPRELEPTRQWAIKTLVVTLPRTQEKVVDILIEASGEEANYGVKQLARQMLQQVDAAAAEAAGIN